MTIQTVLDLLSGLCTKSMCLQFKDKDIMRDRAKYLNILHVKNHMEGQTMQKKKKKINSILMFNHSHGWRKITRKRLDQKDLQSWHHSVLWTHTDLTHTKQTKVIRNDPSGIRSVARIWVFFNCYTYYVGCPISLQANDANALQFNATQGLPQLERPHLKYAG